MKRLLLAMSTLFFAACCYGQTAISMSSYSTPSGVQVTYWVPDNISISQGGVSFCMRGYLTKPTYNAGNPPEPSSIHCYSSRANADQGVIPSAVYSANWPSTLTIGGFNAAAVATAMAVADVPTPGTQFVWQANQLVTVGFTVYAANGHFQKVTTAGWTATSSPAWNGSGGTTAETPSCSPGCTAAVWTDQGASPAAASFFAAGTVTN